MEAFTLSDFSHRDLASSYFLDDVLGGRTPASRLQGILQRLAAHRPLSIFQQEFLRQSGFEALLQLSREEIDMDPFRVRAKAEQDLRPVNNAVANAIAKEKREMERRRRDEVTDQKNAAIFAARERKEKGRRKARELLDRYRQGYIEPEHYGRVKGILHSVAEGEPVGEQDLVWLGSDGAQYWTEALRKAHHKILAERLTVEWRETGDPWAAVNACSHWRKAGKPEQGLPMTKEALDLQAPPKLRSALCTTRGGALRDLQRFKDAVRYGMEAHAATAKDFRPCTLLGAVHIEMGAYVAGAEWYEKAESLGASRNLIDRELQSILSAAPPEERSRIAKALKTRDSARYGWI